MSRGAVHYWQATGVGPAELAAWSARDLELPAVDRPRAVFVHAHRHGEPCTPGCRDRIHELEPDPLEHLERPMTPAHDPPAPATVRDTYGRL